MTNLQIAELLRNVASSYQYKNEQKYKFQIIAYNRAADAVEHSTSELKDLWDDGKLDQVPSIGPSIASHLDEIFKNGKSKHFEEVMKGIPDEAFRLMALPKVGLKTAMKMLQELSKKEIDEKLKESDKIINKTKRHLLPYAENIASEVMEWLKEGSNVIKIDTLGSLRRKVATVGDIDILVKSKFKNQNAKITEYFTKYPKTQKVIEQGEHTASILLPGDVQVDLLVTTPEQYGSALQHFTGSKHHNIALREHALKLGYSLSEYGIKPDKKFKTEEELYNFLGLDYIEPELREDTGEIQASIANSLPLLIKQEDIKGDLQIHSDFDIETSHDLGVSTAEELVKRSKELGYEYIAFTEHNPSKSGHSLERVTDLLKQKEEYVRENDWGLKVFNSLEIDINKDGSLPVSLKGLETLDFALISIHSVFDLSRDEMTKRVLTALSYPKVKIFAHPTARKINEREGIELDWEKIFDFCLKNNKWLEINADPMRLDLPDTLVRDAVKLGIKMTLGTDTHEITMMDNMKYGVNVARRGWATKKDVINCLSLEDFKKEVNI
ncbi:MAG: PHP domain protein [Candidatus Woesebacteria bacterium GW2011_GWA1_33_30]|uniref:PHP domain protein n=1 Tax=Candidatus Woesebacteria bacterium GW2011_GWA2_33_28 TaxID=1618561 RepID=A0A0G0C6X4_9BACT|nr:MAG: PHP domain protein [Candidatus Woesebacteria bacterium GW2011_GWA2_33_28]KKP47885.1 MAG: PHP domain protein [Candidatus Woesebacteria bacterium GW2011_GWA1_33_30]KKP49327.1 MAG: PHP domain protein [Microgenomates group bacterium GW2011_GWC1_33_32]KKP52038.1 MAG: PHP domain protein [Candidatus Woesebacteria bacterium GW2011_GWB1_33_38]KKP57307.1 MAG: PHP domain protein [Microgenomates group bacterium GW2011_GWD1_33_9]